MPIDYEAAAQEQIADADLGEISTLVSEQIEVQKNIEAFQALVDEEKKKLHKLQHETLPEAMERNKLSSFTLTDGSELKIQPFHSISFADKDNKDPAYEWLEQHDAGDIIKLTVTTFFSPKEGERAVELAETLVASGHDVQVQKGVHPMTLRSWLKNNEDIADVIPTHLFNVFIGQVAKIKAAKT